MINSNKLNKYFVGSALVLILALGVVGCGQNQAESPENGASKALSGVINIDGSSTVYPITEAVAEEFMKLYEQVTVNVGVSGTGGGFKLFTKGETVISDASRPIKDSEKEAAAANGIEYIEIPVAYDGLSVVVSKENDWVESMTVEELKKLWEPGSKITKWNQIRPEWPDKKIMLYGPGTDSGTFDYFTEAVVGEEDASRSDYTPSEDDNVLVQGIAGDKYALGYFGYAYYEENKDKLKLVAIDNGKGPVLPNAKTINDGTYAPLSRPIFIYVNKQALSERPEVQAFVEYYLTEGIKLIPDTGYIVMPQDKYDDSLALLK